MHDILALATRYGTETRALSVAAELARRHGGNLTAVYISEPLPTLGAPVAYPEFLSYAADAAREAAEAAPMFERWAARMGLIRARWQVAEGRTDAVLSQLANWHDLLVVESGTTVPAGDASTIGRIVLHAGIPTLMLPDNSSMPASPQVVAIAWNGAPEAMRAVHAALPMLMAAKRVLLIDGQGPAPYSSVGWIPTLEIESYLNARGVQVECSRFEAPRMDVGRELLSHAGEARAQLLVMGAYGHSRFGEIIFGGATEYVLRNARLPVLFCH